MWHGAAAVLPLLLLLLLTASAVWAQLPYPPLASPCLLNEMRRAPGPRNVSRHKAHNWKSLMSFDGGMYKAAIQSER